MGKAMLAVAATMLLASTARGDEWLEKPKGLEEHRLQVVDAGGGPRTINEDLGQTSEWEFANRHLAKGSDYVDSFLGTEVYPEISVRTLVSASQLRGAEKFSRGPVGFENQLDLNLYLLRLRLPIASNVDAKEDPLGQRVGLDLQLPFAIPGTDDNQRLMLVWGAGFPTGDQTGMSKKVGLGYGLGYGGFTTQLRAGYRNTGGADAVSGLTYGGTLGYRMGHFAPVLDAEGLREYGGSKLDSLLVAPGIQIFPGKTDRLQVGVAGLLGFGTPNGGNWMGQRYGGLIDLSINAL